LKQQKILGGGQPYYYDAVNNFKSLWLNYLKVTAESTEPAAVYQIMVDVIFEITDWSVRMTLNRIAAADLGGLKGFSARHLYHFLDDKKE
jgi:hypothetical protein